MKRAAIYARYRNDISQKHVQQDEEQDLLYQIRVCQQYAETQGLSIPPDQIYTDTTSANADLRDRDGLTKLLEAARAKSFDVILVNDLSRLSRNNVQMLSHIRELTFLDIHLCSVADNVDVSEEDSKLSSQMKGIINAVYIDDLKKKTIKGLMAQKERGFFLGERVYGYRSEPSGRMMTDRRGNTRPEGNKTRIVPEEAAVVQRIFEMCDKGESIAAIAEALNRDKTPIQKGAWYKAAVRSILSNEKYTGRWTWGVLQNTRDSQTVRVRPKRREPPLFDRTFKELQIISPKQWNRVQDKLKNRGRTESVGGNEQPKV